MALFGTAGIRGPVASTVTPELALRVGRAAGLDARERGDATFVVGRDGRLSGPTLQRAVVAGHVVGSIHAESRLELREGCRVEGDIRSPIVRLEEGGHLDGEVDMTADDAPPQANAGSRDGREAGPGRTEGAAAARPPQS
jgi:hypothetical protein